MWEGTPVLERTTNQKHKNKKGNWSLNNAYEKDIFNKQDAIIKHIPSRLYFSASTATAAVVHTFITLPSFKNIACNTYLSAVICADLSSSSNRICGGHPPWGCDSCRSIRFLKKTANFLTVRQSELDELLLSHNPKVFICRDRFFILA